MDLVNFPLTFIVLFFFMSISNSETITVRNALVEFMAKLNPENIQREPNFGWNVSSDPCNDNWNGVTCYTNSPIIKKIVLDQLNLTGPLDAASLCVTEALTVLSLNSNNVVGTFPEEISNCTRLTHVYLHGNNLSGNLPNSLSSLSNLKRLDVSDNSFSGNIPDLSRISGLLTFLAENNRLDGGIPDFDFSNLEEFNVSNNNLFGPIPDVGGHFNQTGFLGNPGLCGPPLANACPPPPPGIKRKVSSKKDYLIYSSYAAIGLIVLCLVSFVVIKNRKTKTGLGKEFKTVHEKISSTSSDSKAGRSEFSITSAESGKGSSSLVVLSSHTINGLKFEDLLRSPAELMGRGRHGSLYKVTIEGYLSLAVKRIRDWEISKDEFEKRMRRIGEVKHPNVLPIVAFYCSKQEKLLVYEFQQNGSLFGLLHGSENGQIFGWESRLNVASKISDALTFMHEGLEAVTISHGNIKSSNILLNNAMEPCLSEYGLQVHENQDQSFPTQNDSFQENTTPITKKNAFKRDTYSFGVILLELLTGKVVQNNGYDLARWVNSAIREEWTVEVFDKALVSEGANEEQMVSLLQVALKCINLSTDGRPSIREVYEMINSVKEIEENSISSDP